MYQYYNNLEAPGSKGYLVHIAQVRPYWYIWSAYMARLEAPPVT